MPDGSNYSGFCEAERRREMADEELLRMMRRAMMSLMALAVVLSFALAMVP